MTINAKLKEEIKRGLFNLEVLRGSLPHYLSLDYSEGDALIFEDDSCGFYVGYYRKAFNINVNDEFKVVSIVPRTDELYYHIYILGDYVSTYDDDNGTEHIEFKVTGSLKSKEKVRVKGATFGADRDNGPRPYETFIEEYMSKVDGVADFWKLEFWQNDFVEAERARVSSWAGFTSYSGVSVLPMIIKVLFNIIVKIIRLELAVHDNSQPYRCDCEGLIEGLNEGNVEEMLYLNLN